MAVIIKSVYLLCSCFLLLAASEHSVSKRSLLFPRATVLQFTYGLSVPLILKKRSINFSLCAQVNYDLPFNVTNFETKIIPAKSNEKFDINRRMFYDYVSRFIDQIGLDGKQCLLRSICEISEIPMRLEHKENLLEKIVHFVFTPSLDWGPNATSADSFVRAEKLGKLNGNCEKTYSDCSISIVNLFTAKYLI